MTDFDLVVLAGGTATRMGGGDKTRLDVGGRTLLDRVLAAGAVAQRRVVVGEPRPTGQEVQWTQEDPPGGGPAAALGAGLACCSAEVVAVLAGDLPFVTPTLLEGLVAQVTPAAGVVAVDLDGHPQWLLSAWPVALLDPSALGVGASVHAALGGLPARRVEVAGATSWDCDTPADLDRARRLVATAASSVQRGPA